MALTTNPSEGFSKEVYLKPPTIGTSATTKPDDAEHGERFFETDTGDEYIYSFDETTDFGEWVLYREHFTATASDDDNDTEPESDSETVAKQSLLEFRAVRIGLEMALKLKPGDLIGLAIKE